MNLYCTSIEFYLDLCNLISRHDSGFFQVNQETNHKSIS